MYNTADNDNDNKNDISCLDIQPYTPPPPPPPGGGQDNSFPTTFKEYFDVNDDTAHHPPSFPSLPNFKYNHHHHHHQSNPRKKRTKLIRLDNTCTTSTATVNVVSTKPKYAKKPDPSAPKITRPCSECGKKFWSWKALFGHMRCHPERQWRGINPPPHFRKTAVVSSQVDADAAAKITEQDHEVASCLLMLANGPSAAAAANSDQSPSVTTVLSQGMLETTSSDIVVARDAALMGGTGDHVLEGAGLGPSSTANSRFECSSCKKVFASRQALGGHRASHKNVKGCFAITRKDGEDQEDRNIDIGDHHNNCQGGEVVKVLSTTAGDDLDSKMVMMDDVLGHQCSICFKVFSSGQALGGHKRCHWEKGDEPGLFMPQDPNFFAAANNEGCGDLDLNLPAPAPSPVYDYDDSHSSYSSGLALDLRLGL